MCEKSIKIVILFVVLSVLSVTFQGCNKSKKISTIAVEDTKDTVLADYDTVSTKQAEATETVSTEEILNEDEHAIMPPTDKDLYYLNDYIANRFDALSLDNPIRQNVYSWGIGSDCVHVYMMINTPRWRNKFRQEICDSEHIRFEGPEEPEKINIPVRADISPDSISLLPIADSFPKDSKSVSFSLKNYGSRSISFGENYTVAYQGEDGTWYKLPSQGVYNSIGFSLRKGGNHEFKVGMRPALNDNKPGTYRLYKKIEFEDNNDQFWIMTEFQLY